MNAEPRPDSGVHYVRAEAVLWRKAGGVVLILPLDDGEVFELTHPGPALWDLLVEPITVAAMAGALADMFGATEPQVRDDIEPVLEELARRGVVTVRDEH